MKDWKVVPEETEVEVITPTKVARLVSPIRLGLNSLYLEKIRPYMEKKGTETQAKLRQLRNDLKDAEEGKDGLAHISVSAKIDRLKKQSEFYFNTSYAFRKLMTSPSKLNNMISYKLSMLKLLAEQSLTVKKTAMIREDGSISPSVNARYKNTLREIREAEEPDKIVKLADTDIKDHYDEENELEEDARARLTTLAIKMEKIIQEISKYKEVLDEVKNILGEESKKKGK